MNINSIIRKSGFSPETGKETPAKKFSVFEKRAEGLQFEFDKVKEFITAMGYFTPEGYILMKNIENLRGSLASERYSLEENTPKVESDPVFLIKKIEAPDNLPIVAKIMKVNNQPGLKLVIADLPL